MIVLDKPKLKFLLAGRSISVPVTTTRYRKGRTYSVGTAHNRPATCTATVTGITVTASGFELEIIQNREAEDRYLARYSPRGYTTKIAEALGREDAPCIDETTQARFSKEARERFEQDRERRQAERPRSNRISDLEARAAAGDDQARRHLFMIDKHLQSADRQLGRDAA